MTMIRPVTVTRADIVTGLRVAGLAAGDRVMVHSSLRAFGRVEGGPAAVIAALQAVVTEKGTLLFPSFNHDTIFQDKDHRPIPGACYDPRTSPTIDGIVPETFRKMPGVVRSLNPTHPYAAWGAGAEALVKNHHRVLTMGAGSPLALLEEQDGKVALLGVGYGPNTFKHVVEQTNHTPCLGLRTEEHPVRLSDGRIVKGRTWGWRAQNCPLTEAPEPIATLMAAAGADRRHRVGNAEIIVFRLRECRPVIENLLKNGRTGHPPCGRCPVRPRTSLYTVPSDWDAAHDRLLPGSEALSY
ncbi:MAG: AAC(3) family N-acetyltransferase [Planctomycetota bacterium]